MFVYSIIGNKPPVDIRPQIRNEFTEIVKANVGIPCETLQKRLGDWVISQGTGLKVMEAASYFKECFPKVVNLPITLHFMEEESLNLPFFFVEALKKDSELIKNLVSETSSSYPIPLKMVKVDFLRIIWALYATECMAANLLKPDEDIFNTLIQCNYLDIPSLLNQKIQDLQSLVSKLDPKDQDDIDKGFSILKSIQILPQDIKNKFILEMGLFFGNALFEASSVLQIELAEKLKNAKITCIFFQNHLKMTDATLKLISHWDSLTKLYLFNCPQITIESLQTIPSTITVLNLDFNQHISEKMIKCLPQGLIHLSLGYCCNLTDNELKYLPRGLITLGLTNCPKLTDAGIKDLPKGITALDLEQAYITDAALADLPKGLNQLSLLYCHLITKEGVKKLPPEIKLIIHSFDR